MSTYYIISTTKLYFCFMTPAEYTNDLFILVGRRTSRQEDELVTSHAYRPTPDGADRNCYERLLRVVGRTTRSAGWAGGHLVLGALAGCVLDPASLGTVEKAETVELLDRELRDTPTTDGRRDGIRHLPAQSFPHPVPALFLVRRHSTLPFTVILPPESITAPVKVIGGETRTSTSTFPPRPHTSKCNKYLIPKPTNKFQTCQLFYTQPCVFVNYLQNNFYLRPMCRNGQVKIVYMRNNF